MLLRVGLVMMAFALALTVVAVAVTVAFRDEPVGAVASKSAPDPAAEPLDRSKPDVEPWVEKTREPVTVSEPEPAADVEADPQPEPTPDPEPEPQPRPEREPEPEPQPQPQREPEVLPVREDWPMPSDEERAAADEPRVFDLPRGAVMGLTINALGIRNVPVMSSTNSWALSNGVVHLPGTSYPWSDSAQTNVYLAGHRLGYRGTGSRLIFFRLNRLTEGDEVLLKDRDGNRYMYRVTEKFKVDPGEDWVTGQVRGRDMVTLQTCTPIPTFDKRLIIRADRV